MVTKLLHIWYMLILPKKNTEKSEIYSVGRAGASGTGLRSAVPAGLEAGQTCVVRSHDDLTVSWFTHEEDTEEGYANSLTAG